MIDPTEADLHEVHIVILRRLSLTAHASRQRLHVGFRRRRQRASTDRQLSSAQLTHIEDVGGALWLHSRYLRRRIDPIVSVGNSNGMLTLANLRRFHPTFSRRELESRVPLDCRCRVLGDGAPRTQ